jgi:hypothetical protein
MRILPARLEVGNASCEYLPSGVLDSLTTKSVINHAVSRLLHWVEYFLIRLLFMLFSNELQRITVHFRLSSSSKSEHKDISLIRK